MRAHDGSYEPMIAGPANSDGQAPVNTDLIRIADQAPQPFPVFKDANGQSRSTRRARRRCRSSWAAPTVTGSARPRAYATSAGATTRPMTKPGRRVQDDLTNAAIVTCSKPHEGFTPAQCEGIASQLRDEVSMVAKVTQYFGTQGSPATVRRRRLRRAGQSGHDLS